jgi:hypothetical protein
MRTSLLPALLSGFGFAAIVAVSAATAGTPDAAEIRRLIDQLGSAKFTEREEATAALDAAGEPALPGLRKAAEADDAEVRRRAVDLVHKIEQRVETDHLLAPTKVKLAFTDTPLSEAVAELSRQSGYNIALQDSAGKLKGRKITLDTGPVPFWEALDRLCAKGHLTEQGMVPPPVAVAAGGVPPPVLLPPGVVPPPPVMAPGVRIVPNRPVPHVGQLVLLDNGQALLPSAYAGAVCVRGQRSAGTQGDMGRISVDLVVGTEPKLRCVDSFSLRIEKVVDDRGQELAVADDSFVGPVVITYGRRGALPYTAGFSVQHLQTRLNAGEKPAKSLREIHGMLVGRVFTEPRPVLAAEDVLNGVGKTFDGADGGSIKLLEANTQEGAKGNAGHLTLRFELVLPPDPAADGFPGGIPVRAGGRMRIAAAGGGAVPVPAVPAIAPLASSSSPRRVGGLCLLDDKGNDLRPMGMRMTSRDPRGVVREYTMEFDVPEGRRAARLVYNASKAVGVEVPFTLKDIPLP